MTLARAWTRRIYGASFVALLVPGAVLGSLAVLAVAGGLGRLGAIGQVFSGPAVPSAPAAVRTRAATTPASPFRGGVRTSAAVATRAAATRAGGSAAGGRRVATHGAGRSHGSAAPIRGGGGAGAGRGTGSAGTGRLPGPPAPTRRPSPSPFPSPQPTLTDRVVGTARSVTTRIPGPAGQVATGAVNTVGAAAGKLLPGNGTSAQASGAGSALSGLP